MSQRDTLHSLGVMDETRGGDDSQRRHSKYTEKGLVYQLEVKCKRRSHVFKQLEKKTEYIRGALTQNISASEVKTEHAQWLMVWSAGPSYVLWSAGPSYDLLYLLFLIFFS